MKNIKITFPKVSKILAILGLFSLVLGSFLIPVTQAKAQVVLASVAITASPGVINAGQSSTLNWSSTDATSISITPNTGATLPILPFGSISVSPTQTTTYTITGSNSTGGTGTARATIVVNSVITQNPTVSLTANPTSVGFGGSSILTWTSTNATSCNASGGTNGWTGIQNTSGTFNTQALFSTTTYNITCTNGTGSATSSATVIVGNQPPQGQNPTVDISADDTSIDDGDSTRIRWNSNNATSCTASGGTNGWTGSQGTSGTFFTGSLFSDVTYRITCFNNIGSATDSVTVRVNDNNNNNDREPNVTTRSATNVRNTSATLNGRVSGNGSTVRAWFEYGTNTSLGSSTSRTSYGSGSTDFDRGISGLRENTTYFFRAMAENSEGTARGSILSFNTGGGFIFQPTPPPTIIQTPPTIIYRNTTTVPRPSPSSLVIITSSVDRNQPIVPTLDNTSPRPGDEINYTVTYQNIGTGSITNLNLRLDLPLEVEYMFSNPSNPTISGNTLLFSLGTLRANGQGTVTVRVRVRDNIRNGTLLNFPAILSYTDPSGFPQSVAANVSASIAGEPEDATSLLGANIFGAGFLPGNIFGWLLLIILVLLLVLLAKYIFDPSGHQRTNTIYLPGEHK